MAFCTGGTLYHLHKNQNFLALINTIKLKKQSRPFKSKQKWTPFLRSPTSYASLSYSGFFSKQLITSKKFKNHDRIIYRSHRRIFLYGLCAPQTRKILIITINYHQNKKL